LNIALTRLNPDAPASAIEEAKAKLKNPQKVSLIQNNLSFHHMLTQGIGMEVKTEDGWQGERIKLIDFHHPENNDFLIVNQFTLKGSKMNRRPDIVVFINGIPIFVIELKNPADESADIFKAYNDLQTYKQEIEDLFIFNEACIISDGVNARIGSLTASEERYMYWRTIKDEADRPLLSYELEILIRGFFDKTLLLDYL
ncbi:TPA: DEAD/DEAH box helicase, partial [Legionella pneumophila]|nr:DEAD/DEAH box helicase [Legionella pneumophila]